jgi:hypothetical protein
MLRSTKYIMPTAMTVGEAMALAITIQGDLRSIGNNLVLEHSEDTEIARRVCNTLLLFQQSQRKKGGI